MSFDILKKELKQNNIRNLYLFYGPEEYLSEYYINHIKDNTVTAIPELNLLMLEGEKANTDAIIEFCDSPPMMSQKKLLIVKKFSGFKKRADESKKDSLIDYLLNVPEYACVIFVEEEVNKKNKLYTCIEKNGLVVEFEYQTKEMLVKWTEKIFKEYGKSINNDIAGYLIDNLDPDMQSILNECMKLIDYAGEKNTVTKEDIDKICTKSLSSKVFEMMDSIGQKNLQDAFLKLNDMISLKEPVVKILVLLARHVRIMLQVKMAQEDGLTPNLISKKLGIGFINKYLSQSRNFSIEKLRDALNGCSEADLEIKTKGVDDRIILEKLIVQIAG
jgi:DNA polymerase-3 subunit delta